MTNSLVGDHQVAVVNIDEGVLEGSDMSRTLIIINVIVTKDPNGKYLPSCLKSGQHIQKNQRREKLVLID